MNDNFDYKADLRKRLPELKKIEGFPIGDDEDILKLSIPPFYTACPNPYINEFIEKYGKPYNEETDNYHREPYIGDVSEGKGEAIYNAHTYHTKVPPKAIENYIEHYTKVGDIVLDGFAGTGMTGVACQTKNRHVILNDLSPIASFITYCLNSNIDIADFFQVSKNILFDAENEIGWFYETERKHRINYFIWSEVLICPFCNQEFTFYNQAIDLSGNIISEFNCPNCNAKIDKSKSSKAKTTSLVDGKKLDIVKQIPVSINYFKGKTKHFKNIEDFDIELINKVENMDIPYWYPFHLLPKGVKTSEPINTHNYQYVSQYFTKRNLYVLSYLLNKANQSKYPHHFFFLITSFIIKTGSKLHNIGMKNGKINLAGAMPNALFIPSLFAERNIITLAKGKLDDIIKAYSSRKFGNAKCINQVGSITNVSNIKDESIDYVFTDPPFGDNLMYSELNFLWESWLKVFTNNKSEAIINKVQHKGGRDYFLLMESAFKEYYRVLKPKRWITVEFHNSKSSVWNLIQESLAKAGFIIAKVGILDKVQGTFNQMTNPGSVKSDLVISAYKPSKNFERRFLKNAGEGLETDFIHEFLHQQPSRPIIERTEKMLYSKMLSYYIQHGYEVRYDAKTFYQMLRKSFTEEDGYWFNANQINSYMEYKKKMKLEGIDDVKHGDILMFVIDEKSALVWLHNFMNEPKSFSDIHTAFTQLANIQGDEVPDLKELLEQNFIAENGLYRRPKTEPEHSQVIDKREKQLIRQFESLLIQAQTEKKKIKSIRKEAVQLGFENCYKEKRFQDILNLAKKLDNTILEENAELNEFVDAAEIMVSGVK
jgi:DNA modification methylase